MTSINRRTLDFMLYDWLRAEELTRHDRYADHSRESFDAVLDLSADLAEEQFATHYKTSDRQEPTLDSNGVHILPEIKPALSAFADAGFFSATFDFSLGGTQFPHLVQSASMVHFMAANIATAAYPMLTSANARVIARYGTDRQKDVFGRPQIEGRWLGTMCLSEPHAGSSLAQIATRAVESGEGALGRLYRLAGRKMWISGGDHDASDNIIHLVLAKIQDAAGRVAPGTAGLSLFIVPKWVVDADGARLERNDVVVAGLNHKMGYRGTVNCLLNFGEGDVYQPAGGRGAMGYLVGDVGQGLAIMFQMMNEARIGVGLGAAALALRGYDHSIRYACERRQGYAASSAAGTRDIQVPIIEHADVRRMLLMQKCYSEGALSLILYCAKLMDLSLIGMDHERKDAHELLGLLTPLAKSWPAEFGLAANDLAIQVHGGYGYTRDFDVEQIYRDNRLNPIHEGTNGIQAIDLLKRKILRDEGALARLAVEILATAERAEQLPNLCEYAKQLRAAWSALLATVRALACRTDAEAALDNASAFQSAFGHIVVAWLWLDQCLADPAVRRAGNGRFFATRLFYEMELPKARQQLDFVASMTDVFRAMPQDDF